MGLVAILVNCALIGLSGQVQRMFPEMSATQTILLIVALEHIMLAIRFVITCAIPDIPNWVATEMAKVEFLRREAVRRLSSTPSPEQQSQTVIGTLNLYIYLFIYQPFFFFLIINEFYLTTTINARSRSNDWLHNNLSFLMIKISRAVNTKNR